MSISFLRVEAPGEEADENRNDSEIIPTLPVVLGRGSLLKCGDKRISRRHAYLDWDDDGVMLTSVHQSPTYVIVKGTEKELTEGDALLLSHGDRFGLLKNNFWYKINLPNSPSKGEEECAAKKPPKPIKKNKEQLADSSEKPAEKVQVNSECKGLVNQSRNKKKDSHPEEDSDENKKDHPVPDSNISPVGNKIRKVTKDIAQEQEKENVLSGTSNTNKEKNNDFDSLQTISAQELQMAVSSRKRDLPSWMNAIDSPKGNSSPEKANQSRQSHGDCRKTQSTATKRKQTSKKLKASSDNEDPPFSPKNKTNNVKDKKLKNKGGDISDDSEEDSSSRQNITKLMNTPPKTKKVSPKVSPRPKVSPSPKVSPRPKVSPSPKKASPRKGTPAKKKGSPIKNTNRNHCMSDEEESDDDSDTDAPRNSVGRPKKGGGTARTAKISPKRQSPAKHDVSDDEEEEEDTSNDTSEAATATSPSTNPTRGTPPTAPSPRTGPRQPCRFGANCYRKNPVHLSNFAHVGDPDYYENDSDPEDSDDDRPQCEYGVNCYRKNPQHRKNYRHNRLPQPQRRAKRRAQQQKQRDGSDSDDYDYDDPFLNDGSSDDYAPTDSGDDSPMEAEVEDEEETKRMLKEGKKFVRKS